MPNSVRVRRIVGLGAGRATWSTFNVTLADGRNGIEPYSFEIRSDRGARKKIYYGRPPSVVSMGLSRIRVVVDSLEDERRSQEIELVVDTDATYPVVPASVAEHLGIRPSEELTFTLANGTRLPRKVGWVGLADDGRKTHTRIVFGEAEDVPLLGAFALEGLGVEVDPVARTLGPATQYLL